MKPENIFINNDNKIKLIFFNLYIIFKNDLNNFMSPELFKKILYQTNSEINLIQSGIFSFGIIILKSILQYNELEIVL